MTRTFISKAAGVATVAFAAAVATPVVASAQATELNVSGQLQLAGTGPGSFEVDFAPIGGTTGTAIAFLNDFGIALGTTGPISDLTGSNAGFAPQAVPFLSLGGYTFTYGGTTTGGTFGPIFLTQQGPNVTAGFNVFGTVTGPGIVGARSFNASFTAQFNNTTSGAVSSLVTSGGTTDIVSFSGLITTNVVPEPSTYALMGAGVAMLGAFARRRKLQQQA